MTDWLHPQIHRFIRIPCVDRYVPSLHVALQGTRSCLTPRISLGLRVQIPVGTVEPYMETLKFAEALSACGGSSLLGLGHAWTPEILGENDLNL